MIPHAAPVAPSRSRLSTNADWYSERPAREGRRELLEGVAAQDALVALFAEVFDDDRLPRQDPD